MVRRERSRRAGVGHATTAAVGEAPTWTRRLRGDDGLFGADASYRTAAETSKGLVTGRVFTAADCE